VLIRSRSARFAALALAITTPLVATYGLPAFAADEPAVVSAEVDLDEGVVTVTSDKGLSRVTVVLCDGTVIVSDDWAEDQLTGEVEIGGAVRAVFIHSGNNTTDAAEDLLDSLAPGAVNGNSTGAIAIDQACTQPENEEEENGGGNNGGGNNGGGNNGGGNNTGEGNNGGDNNTGGGNAGVSSENPSTIVLGVRLEDPNTPAAPAPTAAPAPATPVAGNNLEIAGGQLPRTGSVHVQFLMTLALSLIAAGVMLRAAFGRRIRPASSPG
jgi:hypothetical protein